MTLEEIHGEGVLASYNGTCPICSRHVAAGRSHILPLAVALPPDPASLYASRGNLIDTSGRPVKPHEHVWIHARCVRHVPADLELARDERREELRRMKLESRPAGRQPWKGQRSR